MPTYEFKCEQCHKKTEKVFDIKDRKSKIVCDCGGVAKRTWGFGDFYMKHHYIGDTWDKYDVNPQKNQSPEGKKANSERIKAMRKKDEDRVARIREKREKKNG